MVAGAIKTRGGPPEDDALRRKMHKVREEHARIQKYDYSHVFRYKSRFELIRLCCIIVGIEFAYAAETAFVSPTLLEIGINHKQMTMVWSLSPLLGFFLAPLMGSLSDRCTLKLGRRRPLILILSSFILTGLLLVPWGKNIGIWLGDNPYKDSVIIASTLANDIFVGNETFDLNGNNSILQNITNIVDENVEEIVPFYKWAVVVTILGTIFLDFSADTCQTPARTYMLDVCISEDHGKGLSTFTILAGLGGFMGYSLGGIDWEQMAVGQFIGGNVETVFTIVTILFIITSIITLTSFREVPLNLMNSDEMLRPLSRAMVKKELLRNNNGQLMLLKESSPITESDEFSFHININNNNNNNMNNINNNNNNISNIRLTGSASEKQALSVVNSLPPHYIENIDGDDEDDDDDEDDEKITLREYLMSIIKMPRSMQILCFTNLLSWMAHLSYCLYFTDFVGEAVFLGDPMGPYGSEKYELYQSGLRFGCWGMAIYALSCSLYSMVIDRLIKSLGAKPVYVGGCIIYGLGMIILALFPTKLCALLLSISAGVIYATLFTLPYLVLANYHATNSFKVKKGENVPMEKTRGLGTDVAVISSMMFVAQIIISLTIGSLITLIGSTTAVIYAASIFSILAAISASRVVYMDL